jgi:hypothetical protein
MVYGLDVERLLVPALRILGRVLRPAVDPGRDDLRELPRREHRQAVVPEVRVRVALDLLTDDTSADDGANRLAHFDGVR